MSPAAGFDLNQKAAPPSPYEDPQIAVREAFKAAKRRLEDYARERRGDVKGRL